MFSKRLFIPSTVLLAAALFALTLPGCQKDQLTTQETTDDLSLTFRGGSACENGVKLLQMGYQAQEINQGEDKFVELLNNGNREDFQDLNNTSSSNLLEFTPINGTINWGSNFIGITNPGPSAPNWINGTEALSIKLGTSASLAGWKMMAAGIWVTLAPGATVSVQMRNNGADVQPAVTRSNTGTVNKREHITLSLFYLFDEIVISAPSGNVQLQNSALNGTTWNRFVITDNSNDFVAVRQRAGLYFWNSIIDNDHAGLYKPNHQYLDVATGNFVPTPMNPFPNEWMIDGASPNFIQRPKAGGSFGPALVANDFGVNNGESMTFKIGTDVGTGASFTNVVVPIYRPSTMAAIPRVTLRKNGSDIATLTLAQQTGTLQYHLVGIGSDFDEITFTTTTPGGAAASYYEVRTDYWSVMRFSLCQSSGGGGALLKDMPPAETLKHLPADFE